MTRQRGRIATMRPRHLIAFAVLATLSLGSLLATGGYAWYLRSARYRDSCAMRLSASLGLPAEIGRIVPRSRWAREFDRVRVWLPQRRGEAALCDSAILIRTPSPDDPEAYMLDLRGGHCEISTRTWLHGDYRAVLESGLRPGFNPAGPRQVVFSGLDLTFERNRFRAVLHGASGVVAFDQSQVGRATVTCDKLNGHTSTRPVVLAAEFSPQPRGIRLDRVELTVPKLPIAIVGLSDLAGLDLHSGAFSGRLVYRESDGSREMTISGQAFQISLAECTQSLLAQPWHGLAPEVELEELTLVNERPQRLRFRSTFTDAVLGDVLAPWGLGDVGGSLILRVQAADLSQSGIEHFVASGRCDGLSLERVSQSLGWGRMSGRAHVVIDDLTINQNHLAALDARIVVEPSEGQANWIERGLLSEVLRRTIGLSLPSFLPERFEYTQLGVRLEVRDEVLYVFGTHGPRERAILSVNVGGQDIPALFEPANPIDLRSRMDETRTRLATYISERLRALEPMGAWQFLSAPLQRATSARAAAPMDSQTE
jgi:hypothetical protein